MKPFPSMCAESTSYLGSVEGYYDEYAGREWERMDRHRTEFSVTLRCLAERLPPPPAAVIDIGSGPGRYAIELARRSYRVSLVDLASGSLDLARERSARSGVSLVDICQANALDLKRFPAGSFSAALLMGPLYHLVSEAERRQAVGEALRLLQPGGLLFTAFITRFAPFRAEAKQGLAYAQHPDFAPVLLETGVNVPAIGFTEAYFAHPDEVIPFMESCGCQTLELRGVEGVVADLEDRVNSLQGPEWDLWVDLNYRLGLEPSLWGASDHLLYTGIKV